jgi:radical SAM protein with 4Fe4S-binding SPASM domain
MLPNVRRLITPVLKDKIVASLPYRLYNRAEMKKKYIRFSIEITTKCNNNCSMCTRLERVKEGKLKVMDMSPEVMDRILKQVRTFIEHDYQVTFAPMGLGEPLMYKNLYMLFGDLKKISPKIKIVMVTNGVLLSLERSKKLVELGVDEINVSLNVNNSHDYKKYIGGNNYLLVKNNIKKLIEHRNASGKNNTSVLVQYLDYTGKPNKFDNDIKEWSKIMKYGDKCFVHPIVNEGGFNQKMVNFKNAEVFPCFLPIKTIAVRVNGDIYTCDATFFSGNAKITDLYLGNILKVDYFKEIHSNKNSKIYKILDMMKRDDYCKLRNCQKCNNYKLAPNPFFKIIKPSGENSYKWW